MTTLKTRMMNGDILAGTFLKTPAYEMIEVLALSGLDFVCLDTEHSPFDRARMDACLAVARGLGFPVLVRVASDAPDLILSALDSGAAGIVVPHVMTPEKAASVARSARFGHGGRGYAGSTRWAGYATRSMDEVLAMDKDTVVIVQIEEPEGVEAAAEIAAVEGVDGLFVGPADLAVCYGVTDQADPRVRGAIGSVAEAARAHGKPTMTFIGHAGLGAELNALGVRMFFVSSEHAMLLAEARRTAQALHQL